MARFDLIIFDCDGVLVDSEPIIARAHAALLATLGIALAPEVLLARFCGIPDAAMLAVIEQEQGRTLPDDYDARVAAAIDLACATELAPIPGIHRTLDALGLPYCVASSSLPGRIRYSLRTVGLLDRFEPHIFSAAMVARGKPAPDLFRHAAGTMGVPPSRCLVVEDSVAGVTAAVAARMAVIGFCGGGHCPPDHDRALRRTGAALTIRGMADLPAGIATLTRPPPPASQAAAG
jgi:HAD superfamily hydrolase (TIGR01509 family)